MRDAKRGSDAHFGDVGRVALRLLDSAPGMMKISDSTVDQIVRGLAFANQRHAVLAKNLANVVTPGYRAEDVVFEAQLQDALGGGGSGASGTAPTTRTVPAGDGPARADGNDVDVDRQMARLAQNTLFHSALVQVLIGRFATMKQAISGRV